ncbi:hypothetical protein EYR40_008153 [Pleurotus pulmonarius]|nr:hypothetical protein EYR38_007539 [Pleurotus pulmonarius]KAF4597688.1 hypothetical protein EYR40_008153 [Pleurotus pulmonarius]
MSSFAAQIVKDQLISEARKAVKPTAGLYAPLKKNTTGGNIKWNDLNMTMTAKMKAEFERLQPLALEYLQSIAQGRQRKVNGVLVTRQRRPVDLAAVHALAALDFCRSTNARLAPLARGILYLSSTVPMDIITYNSRIGNMPSPNTLKTALRLFSDEKAIIIRSLGQDTETYQDDATGEEYIYVNKLLFDNVQHFFKQRDLRIGRENSMIIGTAATLIRLKAHPLACDPQERQRMIKLNQRENFTMDKLLKLIDFPHLRNIGILQWLGALVKYIPELSHLQDDVALRYRTRCSKLPMAPEKTDIRPLASSGKNEAVISELKDAFIDFLAQLGQEEGDYKDRVWLAGGDGMSFNNMHLLKKHLQAHEDPFQSFRYMEPVLELWHGMWTDLSRLLGTHWGKLLDNNPATLAHSARKIGREPPGNMKKPDYYPTVELVNLVHDMRMLDCWRLHFETSDIFTHFTTLHKTGSLPSFEELEIIAHKLFDSYSTTFAQYQAEDDARTGFSDWAAGIPEGSVWSCPLEQGLTSSNYLDKTSKRRKEKRKVAIPSKNGDQTLSETIVFMRDALISREVAYAVAEGDVGRAWEAMKVTVFTFAGSNHSKYTSYMLEMICLLERETHKELREAIMKSLLVNLSGKPGDWQPADIVQELLNRCLEPVIQRKDSQFGSYHIRHLWSRNIMDIYQLKADMREDIGLSERTGKHTKPHEKPEVRILLKAYMESELHHRRPGRHYGIPRDVDDMQRGINALSSGGLLKWVTKTTNNSNLREV